MIPVDPRDVEGFWMDLGRPEGEDVREPDTIEPEPEPDDDLIRLGSDFQ